MQMRVAVILILICLFPFFFPITHAQCVDQDPNVFPSQIWRCDVFDDLNFSNYQGYYFRDNWSFQTPSDWGWDSSPSEALGYIGCSVAADNHTISVKRQGFPFNADGYQIVMNQWDDDAFVFVDGQQVWSTGCCASGVNSLVWEGILNETSTVEVRMREYGGASFLGFTLVELCANTTTYYLDSDNDGFGDANAAAALCNLVPGYSTNALDCNDSNSTINPDSNEENCNDLDDNCNGEIDEAFDYPNQPYKWTIRAYNDISYTDFVGHYSRTGLGVHTLQDWNADGSPSMAQGWIGCNVNNDWHSYTVQRTGFTSTPTGYTLYMNDWDDDVQCFLDGNLIWSSGCCAWNGNAPIWSGQLDANSTLLFKLIEYGGGSNLGFTLIDNSSGCADETACNYNPSANSDDGSCYYPAYYFQDADGDGEGNLTVSTLSCNSVSGYVLNFDDCDDSNQFIGSAAGELCNDFDDNCNGLIDEELEVYVFYADLDADGYGFGAEQLGCIMPLTGVSSNNLDCDDANAEINPSIAEIQGNQIDEDCDGNIESHVFSFLESDEIQLSPNPAKNILTISCGMHHFGKPYFIFNAEGKLVSSGWVADCLLHINVQQWEMGTYVLQINETSHLFQVQSN
ncbi:MAG: hypothetical protein RIR06_1282 [Bacteroidota bacterium]|jgi:hypothetical protein